MICVVIGVVLGAVFFHGEAAYDGITIDEAVGIFSDVGLTATKKISTKGEPYLGSSIAGNDFEIHFYNCDGGKKCHDMALWAGLPVRNASLEPLNKWNEKSRVTVAFLNNTKDIAFLRMDIPTCGGVTRSNLKYYLKSWRDLMLQYFEYLQTGRLP